MKKRIMMTTIIFTFIIMTLMSCTLGEVSKVVLNNVNPNFTITTDGKIIRTKIVEIVGWDMNALENRSIPHGLGIYFKNIISVSAFIYQDGVNVIYPINTFSNNIDPQLLNGGIGGIDATNIEITRRDSGVFDSTDFDDSVMLRGYIAIVYFE